MSGFRSILFSGGDSAALVENTVFVDAAYGDDVTAERENPSKPFLTIPAALAVYLEGDVMILNGDFVSLVSIGLPNPVVHFVMEWLEGSSLTADISDSLFKTTIAAQSYEIHGHGTFRNDNAFVSGSTRCFGGRVEIFGAKSISTFRGGVFSGGGWRNIRNVEEIYTESGTAVSVFPNVEHDGITGGFIENVHFGKIGHAGFPMNAIVTSMAPLLANQYLTLNNVQAVGSSLSGLSVFLIGNGSAFFKVKAKNCRFIGNTRQRVVNIQTTNQASFHDCYFESNADLTGVSANGTVVAHFTDCSFKSGANATTILVTADAQIYFHGTNQHETVTGTKTLGGVTEDDYYNTGVLLLNKAPQNAGLQFWEFLNISEPPTVGDSFTITANDGNSITEIVLLGDTQNLILARLRDTWIAKGEEPLENDFTHFTPSVVGIIGTQKLRGIAIDVDFNYDLEENEAWTWSTTGLDPINVPTALNSTGASIVGGEVNIDANLTVY